MREALSRAATNTRILKFTRDVCQDCNARGVNYCNIESKFEFIIRLTGALGNLDPRETRF